MLLFLWLSRNQIVHEQMTAIMRALRDSISIDWDGPADHAAVQRPAAALFRSSRASVRWEVKEDKAGDNEDTAVRVGVVGWKKCNWLRWSGETSEFPAQQPPAKQTKGNQLKNVFGVYFLFGETDISLRYSAEGGDFSFFLWTRDEIGNSFLAVSWSFWWRGKNQPNER